mgnify:FL=1
MEDETSTIEQPTSFTTDTSTGQEPIGSSMFQNTATLDFKEPNYTPIFNPQSLGTQLPEVPELQATQPEKQADDLTTRLQSLNEQLVGQSAYRGQQEAAQGLPELQKTQTDLSSRLTALQNESLQIPLQLQQESIARGRTEGGLRPLESAALRNNAIQALSINSLLQASRGNITLAMDNVERAVAQRFDPIKEEIATKTANLNLILQSPAYSREDKKRAEQRQSALAQQQAAIAKQEENNKIGQAMAAAAVKLYPGDQAALMAANQALALDPSDPVYLQRVFGLLGQFQQDPVQFQKDLDEHLFKQAQIEQAGANIEKTREELKNAPLERKRLEADIARIEADTSLTPL